ncbi:MAG: hypothetical protein V7K32_05385 [Nostoc sp.]|uniref:hypothetical protein n=1 Tax=Nostoc sp. TaxID=1180 RepID=UPI002FFA8982
MFSIQLKQRCWNQPEPPVKKGASACKPFEVEAINQKSFKFALSKTTEYIRNMQRVYYLEFRLFF